MAGLSKRVTVRPQNPFSPNCLHMPVAGSSTIQLFANAYDQDDLPISPGFTWATDNPSIATVSSSGLVTSVATGICHITANANDNIAAKASTPVGVALLSANSVTISYGQTTTLSSIGGLPTVNWVGGCPGAAEVVAGTLVNGFVVPDHSSTAWNSGPTATIKTPVFTGSSSFTATAHVPVQVSVGGIYCMATVNVTGVPNWQGA